MNVIDFYIGVKVQSQSYFFRKLFFCDKIIVI
jgi:hypothetical protein